MRLLALAALALTLAGCGGPTRVYQYAPPDSKAPPMTIHGNWDSMMNGVYIYVNGKRAAKGHLTPIIGTGVFYGEYKGWEVVADCVPTGMLKPPKCLVYIDGAEAALLEFR